MENNRMLLISMAGTRKTKHWPRMEFTWAEFVEKLKTPVRSTETLEEYLSYAKVKQDELKDVGGFVGGIFAGDIRKAAYVEGRDLLTLDMDNIPAGRTEDILRRVAGLGCNAAVYSTRKHCGYAPRLRVIVPLDRTATADEYEPAARKLASLIGIEFCDPTTFDVARLMYWPSCCRDSEYICEVYDRPFCSLRGLLQMYGDWTDISQWPQVPGTDAVERRRLAKQENPTEKKGIIGAFCRTYSITQAMEKFIPGMYEPTDVEGRYTYTGGSTIGGAIVYDGDLFLYSHHATDPCSGLLVNAFDLIRLHMYGDQDQNAKEGTPNSKLPSFISMTKLASNDKAVSGLLAKETFEKAQNSYDNEDSSEELDLAWLDRLTRDGNGKIAKTINNAVLVLENDPLLKGKIVTDEFASCGLILGRVPWSKETEKRRWKDEDDAGFYPLEEMHYAKILAIRFLLNGNVSQGSGRFKTYREMPWGEVYLRQFDGRCIKRLAFTYGNRLKDFKEIMEHIHAVPVDHGDIAYQVEIFPGYVVQMILWEGDDEFPPSSQILFSDNFPVSFAAEDMAVMGDVIIGSLKAFLKCL